MTTNHGLKWTKQDEDILFQKSQQVNLDTLTELLGRSERSLHLKLCALLLDKYGDTGVSDELLTKFNTNKGYIEQVNINRQSKQQTTNKPSTKYEDQLFDVIRNLQKDIEHKNNIIHNLLEKLNNAEKT